MISYTSINAVEFVESGSW